MGSRVTRYVPKMPEASPRRNLQRVLAACTGGDAAVVVRSVQAMGLEVIAAFDEASAEAPWVESADWEAPLVARDADDDPWGDPQRLVSAALDAGADALHPGAGQSAASTELARLTTASGLAWLGVQADLLERWAGIVAETAASTGMGIGLADRRITPPDAVRVGVIGDGLQAILLGQQRLLTAGLAEVSPCPDPIARAAIALAAALRLSGLASFDLALDPTGRVTLLAAQPSLAGWFMFDQALGADLVAAQIQIATGEGLRWESERPVVRPTVAAVLRTVADCAWDHFADPIPGGTLLVGAGPLARSTPVLLLARSAPTLLAARVQLGEALRECPFPHTNAAALRARLFEGTL